MKQAQRWITAAFICLLSLMLLSSCTTETPEPTGVQKISGYIEKLCSKEFAGRSPGTEGNYKAADWLVEKLMEFNIEPYGSDDYKIKYKAAAHTFEKSEMALMLKDGTEKKLAHAVDFFIPNSMGTFDASIRQTDDSYRLYGENDETVDYTLPYRILEASSFNNTVLPGGLSALPNKMIQVSPDVYRILAEDGFSEIKISNAVKQETKEVYNATGIIRGTSSDSAVVLTAHFDHVGESLGVYFAGALDNAGGTASLLYIAEILRNASEESPYPFDIIIGFCNSEESGWDGSELLASLVKKEYKNLFNINIDCIGLKGGNVYMYPASLNGRLNSLFTESLESSGLSFSEPVNASLDDYPSDNASFTYLGIPAVYLGVENWLDTAHTLSDTPDKLDAALIAGISEAVAGFVSANGDETFAAEPEKEREADSSTQNVTKGFIDATPEILEGFKEIIDKVRNGEDARFTEDYVPYMTSSRRVFYTYHDYLERYPDIETLKEFGGFSLGFINCQPSGEILKLAYFSKDSEHVVTISVSGATIQGADYKLVDGSEGYTGIYNGGYPWGFLYENEGLKLVVQTAGLKDPSAFSIGSFSRFPFLQSDNELKTFIEDCQFEEFVQKWKDYQ